MTGIRLHCESSPTAIKGRWHDTRHTLVTELAESRAGHQAGLTQSRQRVAQLRQPTSQAPAGCVADLHELDRRPGTDSALVQIRETRSRPARGAWIETVARSQNQIRKRSDVT